MNTPRRDILYYDGQCGLCRRSVRIIRTLDWLGRLDSQDSTEISDDQLPVDRSSSLTGIPMLTRGGETLVGFPAIRRALRQTPLGVIPAMLLYLPGFSHLGKRAYDRIAARRSRTAACKTSEG